jgi:Ser/Thr protein kinase RdoA (MazF antagonist)
VIAGYHGVRPLSAIEQELVMPLVCVRLTTSVIFSTVEAARAPDNEYLTICQQPAWRALAQLTALETARGRECLLEMVRAACRS